MWTASIESKVPERGLQRIGVRFENGADFFTESHLIKTQVQLDNIIKGRLRELNESDAHLIQIGNFNPLPDPTPSLEEEKLILLRRLKSLVELGLMKETDPEYLTALSEAKAVIQK